MTEIHPKPKKGFFFCHLATISLVSMFLKHFSKLTS